MGSLYILRAWRDIYKQVVWPEQVFLPQPCGTALHMFALIGVDNDA